MPAANITNASIGSSVPLCYGFVRATGQNSVLHTVPGTASILPNMQLGFYLLGEGEWDGCDALWNAGALMFSRDPSGALEGFPASSAGTLNFFNFHPGIDAPLLSDTFSANPQQEDVLWGYLNGLATPLNYSRVAYSAIGWTPASGSSASLAPVGDYRAMRCRIFDGDGNQMGYRFTTNPAWHFVDTWLRRAIKPEYTIKGLESGAEPLTVEELACFNWESIYSAAQYFDELLANGRPRFSGSYAFASGTTLAAMHETILLSCRSYQQEYAGQIYLNCDKPRASTFILSAKHLVPGSFAVDNQQIHQNGNRYIAQYLELGLPAIAKIATAVRTSSTVVFTTEEAHPCAANDLINVGVVADSTFDRAYTVAAATELTITCNITGGVPASSTGGAIGYQESRFSERAPEISHAQHQRAMGQVLSPAAGGSRLKRVKVSYNFANCTYDQQNRLLKYEVFRDLGADQTPYRPPIGVTLEAWAHAVDANGNALKAQLPGDVITLDPSVFYEFAGDYELMERYINPFQMDAQQQNGSFIKTPDPTSGTMKLVMRTFDPGCFFDVSDEPDASFATVPGNGLYSGGESGEAAGSFLVLSGTMTLRVAADYHGTVSPETVTVSWADLTIQAAGGSSTSFIDDGRGLSAGTGYTWYMYVSGSVVSFSQNESDTTGHMLLLTFTIPHPTGSAQVNSYNLAGVSGTGG